MSNEPPVPVGTRIQLTFMEDPYDPIPFGSQGTVIGGNDFQLLVDWDSGRKLNLVLPEDKYEVIYTPEE